MNKKSVGKDKKVTLNIIGACGNQFFQYAFARYLMEKTNAQLVINYSGVRRNKGLWAGSDNLLKDFNTVDYTYTTDDIPKDFWIKIVGKIRQLFRLNYYQKRTFKFIEFVNKCLLPFGIYYYDAAYKKFPIVNNKNILIYGYYESAKYFSGIDDEIKKELTPKHALLEQNIDFYDKIQSTESVCVTIKRQDIENPDISSVYKYDMSYFYAGIEYVKGKIEHPVFFVFADDIEWCRHNVKIDGEYYFETDNNPIWEKVRLMSSCKHFIIHNSTFSWWAQHLSANPDKIVLAPVKWMQRDDQPIDIYEDNWLYITPDGTITDKHE